jgi:hypothetical protein
MTMKKLIAIAMFAMFAVASGASQATVTHTPAAMAHAPAAVASLSSSSTVETGAETHAFDPVCSPAYVQCTLECQDLSGSARGACLRICRAEYEECLRH